jgi:hypothetical protein
LGFLRRLGGLSCPKCGCGRGWRHGGYVDRRGRWWYSSLGVVSSVIGYCGPWARRRLRMYIDEYSSYSILERDHKVINTHKNRIKSV